MILRSPLWRDLLIGLLGFGAALGLLIAALLNPSPTDAIPMLLLSALLAAATGVFEVVQAWLWSGRMARAGMTGRSVTIAVAGGLSSLIAAGAAAGVVMLMGIFYLA